MKEILSLYKDYFRFLLCIFGLIGIFFLIGGGLWFIIGLFVKSQVFLASIMLIIFFLSLPLLVYAIFTLEEKF